MATISARWRKLTEAESLRRSSHVLLVLSDVVYVFGGELRPREPRDNEVYVVEIGSGKGTTSTSSPTKILSATPPAPSPRVGATATSLHGRIYIFAGRGGAAMTALEESTPGSFWVFDPAIKSWKLLSPADTAKPYPQPRSYHAMTNDGDKIIYIHAGCPAQGRLADLWSFDISTREWKELAPAPGQPRGGTSIAFSQDYYPHSLTSVGIGDGGYLYRLHGFDGEHEIGGEINVYFPSRNTWATTQIYTPDGRSGPEPRSVASLVVCEIKGEPYLMAGFGEGGPSSNGHAGAGRMLDDVWLWNLSGNKAGWLKVPVELGKQGERPQARGWAAVDKYKGGIVLGGGLAESNERLGDIWLLEFD